MALDAGALIMRHYRDGVTEEKKADKKKKIDDDSEEEGWGDWGKDGKPPPGAKKAKTEELLFLPSRLAR